MNINKFNVKQVIKILIIASLIVSFISVIDRINYIFSANEALSRSLTEKRMSIFNIPLSVISLIPQVLFAWYFFALYTTGKNDKMISYIMCLNLFFSVLLSSMNYLNNQVWGATYSFNIISFVATLVGSICFVGNIVLIIDSFKGYPNLKYTKWIPLFSFVLSIIISLISRIFNLYSIINIMGFKEALSARIISEALLSTILSLISFSLPFSLFMIFCIDIPVDKRKRGKQTPDDVMKDDLAILKSKYELGELNQDEYEKLKSEIINRL